MAINAYTGLMGSGKSYEVVENVILPALLAGRRVVTNVANLQQDDIAAYLVEKHDAELAKLGQIVQVLNEDIEKPDFFPVESAAGEVALPSIVLPGDLVVIDECWRWWASGSKISPAHMIFFRMHRHFVNPETKATCDMVLVVQDIGDLDRKLKVVVENTYRMSKHKALGLSTRYRVDLYASYKTTRAPYRTFQRRYNKEIFALYQSYSQGGGKSGNEVAIDDRANIFKGAAFRVIAPVLLILFGVCFWLLWRFFHPVAPPVSPVSVGASGASSPAAIASTGASQSSSSGAESDWRVVGNYQFGLNRYVIISKNDAFRTLINPKGFYFDALRAVGSLDGQLLTSFTGVNERSRLLTEPTK